MAARRSAAARPLRLWVRISPRHECFSVECFVLSGRGLCGELITGPEVFYRLGCVVVCDLETARMRRPWPAVGRSAKKKMYEVSIFNSLYSSELPNRSLSNQGKTRAVWPNRLGGRCNQMAKKLQQPPYLHIPDGLWQGSANHSPRAEPFPRFYVSRHASDVSFV